MATIYMAGAETGDAVSEGAENDPGGGAMTADSATKRTGGFSFKATGDSTTSHFQRRQFTGAHNIDYYWRGYMQFSANPGVRQEVFEAAEAVTFGGHAYILLQTDGSVIAGDSNGLAVTGTQSAVLATGVWHLVETHWKTTGTPATGTFEYKVNGTLVYSNIGGWTTLTAATGANYWGMGNTAVNVWWDDIVCHDSNGANNNTWPGDGSVVLLVPTADSAGGTGWTLGTGTALGGNAWNAVDNKPPLGVADLTAGSDPKQIRNATANANVNYDATMTTYAAAGITPMDKINAVVPIVATAAPVTTSSKQGTVGIASNPTIANVALSATGTSGAFWSGVAAGTYPTGWKYSGGTVSEVPAVTLGTAPVMRITQVTSSTRIAMVSAMGILVHFTVGQVPYVNPMPPLLAQ